MRQQKNLQGWAQKEMDKGLAEIQKHINDPDVPEETKKELRETLKKLQSGKKELKDSYKHNKKWADWAMKLTRPLTNKKDIQVILRHQNELMEVFTGLSREQLEQIQENSMRLLKN